MAREVSMVSFKRVTRFSMPFWRLEMKHNWRSSRLTYSQSKRVKGVSREGCVCVYLNRQTIFTYRLLLFQNQNTSTYILVLIETDAIARSYALFKYYSCLTSFEHAQFPKWPWPISQSPSYHCTRPSSNEGNCPLGQNSRRKLQFDNLPLGDPEPRD